MKWTVDEMQFAYNNKDSMTFPWISTLSTILYCDFLFLSVILHNDKDNLPSNLRASNNTSSLHI
jgi:hypothetical protein